MKDVIFVNHDTLIFCVCITGVRVFMQPEIVLQETKSTVNLI